MSQRSDPLERVLRAQQRFSTASLETPSETIQRVGWAQPALSACLRAAVELKLFEKLTSVPKSSDSLANEVGASPLLIARILRHLNAEDVVAEPEPDTFVAHLTQALTEPRYSQGMVYTYDVAGLSFRQLPAYLKKTDYEMPTKLEDGPFQFAHNSKVPFWVWLAENDYLDAFNAYMAGYRQGKPVWTQDGFYPVTKRLLSNKTSDDEVLLVDVGGGMGHDLAHFKSEFSQAPGRLVLQERPEVVDSLKTLPGGIEAQKHDFFTEQPVQGARAYYLHSVLHDWDDESCIKILQQLRPAIKAGHSKLLVNELIIPDKEAHWSATSMDFLMMVLGGIRERTEAEWRRLIEKASFKVEGIWTFEPGAESIIEAS
ncbi:MAG: hypothetical protein M1828_005808 [Chrysothrix sp. TS-e1954]|nr:MAG: hypothetical protein M1828_005808 [Chrysothrix sp. TS-e1954]